MPEKFRLYQINVDDFGRPVVPDERDKELARKRLAAWNKRRRSGPRVGDFITMPDGSLQRFSYNWGDTIQTSEGGSYHIFENGNVSMSGSRNPGVQKDHVENTGKTRMGDFWFFHHDWPEAHHGVGLDLPCRIYRLKPGWSR